ncbi:MAG TPA: M1 family aminopeptidase [Gemmatales bacterium]|nr:M1 family aminopeptidase [Gemmatales bacterium]
MFRIRFFYAALALSSLGCVMLPVTVEAGIGKVAHLSKQAAKTDSTKTTPTEPLRTASDRKINIRNIRLDLKVDVEKRTVVSQAAIQFQTKRPTTSLNLDAAGFEVKKVMLAKEGQTPTEAKFSHDGKKLNVELGKGWTAGQTGTVNIEYLVSKPKNGLHFFGPTKANPQIPLQVWSQGETVTNRFWIPCIDEPDQRQTTQVVVTVPAGFEAISNGKLMSRRENADNTVTFDWFQDKPHPSYLITLVVGQFDVVTEDWNGIPVMYYMPKGRKAEALPTYGKTPQMMTYFSSRFGIPYPWDKYAQISAYQFGGGMENTSATTMGDGILKDQRQLLDGNSESIVSHELAHQWWGDLVTCKDWSHTWLNEGFASYAEALWDEHTGGKDAYDLEMFQKSLAAMPAGRVRPIMDRRYPNPDSMFDGRAYPKGAWVLHMLRNRLGDDAFFKSLKQYGTDFRLRSAETGDFRRSVERTSDRDLERFFYDWVERPGHPDLEVTSTYNPETKKVDVVAKQTQAGEVFHLPLKVAVYVAGASEPVIVDEDMKDKELKLSIPVTGVVQRVEVDPDLAVLTNLKEVKSAELWRDDLLKGSTVPVRLRALQHFQNSKEAADKELIVAAFEKEKFNPIKTRLANIIGNAQVPAGKELLFQGLSSPDARVRLSCLTNLAKYKGDEKITEAVRNIIKNGDASLAVEGAALRAYAKLGQKDAITVMLPWLEKPGLHQTLANAVLTGLGDLEDPAALDGFIAWTEPTRPRLVRGTANRALVQLIKSKKLNDEQKQKALKHFQTALEGEDQFLHFAMLTALPDFGPMAEQAVPTVEKLIKTLPEGNLLDTAKSTLGKIQKQTKAAPSEEKEKPAKP